MAAQSTPFGTAKRRGFAAQQSASGSPLGTARGDCFGCLLCYREPNSHLVFSPIAPCVIGHGGGITGCEFQGFAIK